MFLKTWLPVGKMSNFQKAANAQTSCPVCVLGAALQVCLRRSFQCRVRYGGGRPQAPLGSGSLRYCWDLWQGCSGVNCNNQQSRLQGSSLDGDLKHFFTELLFKNSEFKPKCIGKCFVYKGGIKIHVHHGLYLFKEDMEEHTKQSCVRTGRTAGR